MAPEKKVMDSSIIAKWFLNETDSAKALKLRDDHIKGKILIVVPELAFIEVINALRYKNYDAGALSKANSALWDIQLRIEKLDLFLLEKAHSIALKYDLSIYDSLYIALAGVFNTFLITADKELKKVPNVVLIG